MEEMAFEGMLALSNSQRRGWGGQLSRERSQVQRHDPGKVGTGESRGER